MIRYDPPPYLVKIPQQNVFLLLPLIQKYCNPPLTLQILKYVVVVGIAVAVVVVILDLVDMLTLLFLLFSTLLSCWRCCCCCCWPCWHSSKRPQCCCCCWTRLVLNAACLQSSSIREHDTKCAVAKNIRSNKYNLLRCWPRKGITMKIEVIKILPWKQKPVLNDF